MSDEIRRRKTADPEMDAMVVMTQAFAGLERAQVNRILQWAEDRYVRERQLMPFDAMESCNNFIKGIHEAGRRLNVDGQTMIRAIARIADELPAEQQQEVEVAG